jgi:RNA polymerase sigma factor (sigma-70 family)
MRDEDFERLYAEEAQGLYGYLAYRTGDRMLAQDLLADVFERALRARGRYDKRKGSARTWLYAIAGNLLVDHARRQAAGARAAERAGAPVESELDRRIEALPERDALARALATLSDEEREAVALRFGADLTLPEMAQLMGEPLTTVEGRVYRALRKLRAALDPERLGRPGS